LSCFHIPNLNISTEGLIKLLKVVNANKANGPDNTINSVTTNSILSSDIIINAIVQAVSLYALVWGVIGLWLQ
jgi:hypothetical protein